MFGEKDLSQLVAGVGEPQRTLSLPALLPPLSESKNGDLVRGPAMHTSRLRHYRVRLRRSQRLRYRLARLLLGAISLLLLISVAYVVAGRG